MSLDVLWLPVLISSAPSGLERVLVASVLWVGVGALAAWAFDFRRRLTSVA